MPNNIHPNAPAGGGGPGHFKSAGPTGTNPDMDRWNRPGPLGIHHESYEDRVEARRHENEAYLRNSNVKAFLDAIAWAEGGDYDLKYGGVKGRKNDATHITDYSLPPQPGVDGKTTASGRYQINLANWTENGKKKMGVSDFAPKTQDLIAVEGLRQVKALDAIISGDMESAITKASKTWNALPQGKDGANRVSGQHYVRYADFIATYKASGGIVTKE